MEDCLSRIIGVTNRDCECTNTGKPDDSNESLSGLFIDDKFEGVPLLRVQSSLNCEDELYKILEDARAEAISDFKTDLIGQMQLIHKSTMNTYKGTIGDPDEANKILPNTKNWLGCMLQAKKAAPPSAAILISNLGLLVNQTGEYTVHLYRNDFDSPVTSWVIDAVANVPTLCENPSPILLPFGNEFSQMNTYYLVYESNGADPYNTKFHCGCGSKPSWVEYLKHDTYSQNTLTKTSAKDNKPTNGIYFHATINCGAGWMCNTWDFKNDPWARTMAKTIQLMSIMKVLQYCVNSDLISKYTLLEDEDSIAARFNYLSNQISGRMTYLTSKIPDNAKDCWKCYPKTTMVTIKV